MGKKKSKKSSSAKAAAAAASRGVVGPNYIQVLTGQIATRNISLILCGESHEDAIDVTRVGGGKMKEDWEPTDHIELIAEMIGKFGGIIRDRDVDNNCCSIKIGICKRNTKLLPLGKAQEWGRDIGREEIEYMEPGHEMVLLWVPSKDNDMKGRSYLIELFLHQLVDDDDDDDISMDIEEESDKKQKGGMIGNKLKKQTSSNISDKSRSHHPTEVIDLVDNMWNVAKHNMAGVKSLQKVVDDMKKNGQLINEKSNHNITLLQWADTDNEARSMNHRRLLAGNFTADDITTAEYDTLICNRKERRKKNDNLWTWDDWLIEVRSKLNQQGNVENNSPLHLVLETPIPPSEVELCKDLMEGFQHTQAGDFVRCLSEDSSESSIDMHDPASDGFGGYIPHIHRRFMSIEKEEKSKFLHCVDCRDLGCQHETEECFRKEWLELLDQEEREQFLGSGSDHHTHHNKGRCLPDWTHNPEEAELDRLRDSGMLKSDDAGSDEDDKNMEDGEVDDKENSEDLITFPSFENFLNVSDTMYYTPNVKTAFAPFLGKTVKSPDNWNSFFAELFLGGTVERALSMLELENNGPHLHTRSPIMKFWNTETGEYELHRRCNEENDLTLPLLPINSFLKAKGSSPARTWTSHIFASLLECGCHDELKDMAAHIKEWTLSNIAKQCNNPKQADNEIGGGEWFMAYLRECHRDIYEDIDRSDPQELLRKINAAGTTKKHKVGDITIPSCTEGFKMITKEMENFDDTSVMKFSKSSEVMAKICIDIYMNKLVDAATLAKILQIISQESERTNIVIVCYMGSCHTKDICDFFMQSNYGFKKKLFCGKHDWEDEEGKILYLPPELWNLKSLFNISSVGSKLS